MSLFNTVISGAKWTTMDSIVSATVQIARVFILTKLLTPSDFGLMALVLVITGLSKLFIDLGLKNAIIYKSTNTNNQLSTLYWLNVIIGAFMTIAVFFLSEIISIHIFNEVQLESILKIVSLVFLFNGFVNQYNTLLIKNLKFDVLAKIHILSTLLSFVITVLFAYNGFGVYSLVIGYLVQSGFVGCLSILSSYELFSPKFYFNLKEVKEYLNFGGYQMLEIFTSFGQRQGDSILIGVFLNTEVLGLYSVAKILIKRPIELVRNIIGKMAFPVFSKIKDPDQLRRWALSSQKAVYLVMLPVLIFLISFPEYAINFIYGSDWIDAVPILRLLAIMFSVRMLRSTFGPILLSRGLAKKSFQLNLWLSIIYLLCLGIGLQFSLTHTLYILIFTELFIFQVLNYLFILKPILKFSPYSYFKVIIEVFSPLLIACMIIAPFSEYKDYTFDLTFSFITYLISLSIALLLFYVLNKKSIFYFTNRFIERKEVKAK
jgi:O-antigen/teichoic acid export membrane protein